MPKNKKEAPDYGYDAWSDDQIKDAIIRLLKEIKALEAEKKDYVKSISESVKELKERIDNLIYWLGVKQTEADKQKLVEAAQKVMEPQEG